MNKKRQSVRWWIILGLIVLVGIGGFFLLGNLSLVRLALAEVFSNQTSIQQIPCEQLPTETEVRERLEANRETVDKIEAVHPGHVEVVVWPGRCAEKAGIRIYHATQEDREQIEVLIDGDELFGVPYEFVNR
jgi:hypothetical protein